MNNTMVNYNGSIIKQSDFSVGSQNRAFRYGDGLFETMRYSNGLIYFYEDHYFRLMGSMCMMRVDIPSELNMEMLYEQILNTIESNGLKQKSCRVRLHFFRSGNGLYTPEELGAEYLIEVEPLEDTGYVLNEEGVSSDIYFDHAKTKAVLSSIKSNNALVYILASVFAKENNIDQVFILNSDQEIIETQHSNIIVIKDKKAIVPTPDQGALDGVVRKQMIKLLEEDGYEIVDDKLRAYEINIADQVFVTNSISGIQYVNQFRKKTFTGEGVQYWQEKLEKLAMDNKFA